MNISDQIGLACLRYIEPNVKPIEIQPSPYPNLVRDLIPDLTNFYNQYRSIKPGLKRKDTKAMGDKEYFQSPQRPREVECHV